MNSLLVMEWNDKPPSLWDWDNVFMYGAKATEDPNKPQPTEWSIEGEQGMNSESFCSPGGDGASGVSGSDLGDGSSKSSKSGSVSSSVGESKKSNFILEAFEGIPKELVDREAEPRIEPLGYYPTHEISAGSGEPFLSLKLGKTMYFEDVCAGNSAKTSSVSVISTPMETNVKKFKSTSQSIVGAHCQVEGCNMDLSSATSYHRKHKICANHSKSPKVIVNGVECRFCQQCSRFHGLSEFDEKKRSCRRRLSDHNARRRKPQQEAPRNPARLSSSLYSTDGRQHMDLVLDQAAGVYLRHATDLSWGGECGFKFTQTKAYLPNHAKSGSTSKQLNLPESRTPFAMLYQDSSRLPPSQGAASHTLNQGAEETMISFNVDAPQGVNSALSLLSASSWASSEAKPVSLDYSYHTNMPQPLMPAMNQGLPVSSVYWQNEQPSLDTTQAHVTHSQSNANNHFQVLNGPCEFGYNSIQFS